MNSPDDAANEAPAPIPESRHGVMWQASGPAAAAQLERELAALFDVIDMVADETEAVDAFADATGLRGSLPPSLAQAARTLAVLVPGDDEGADIEAALYARTSTADTLPLATRLHAIAPRLWLVEPEPEGRRLALTAYGDPDIEHRTVAWIADRDGLRSDTAGAVVLGWTLRNQHDAVLAAYEVSTSRHQAVDALVGAFLRRTAQDDLGGDPEGFWFRALPDVVRAAAGQTEPVPGARAKSAKASKKATRQKKAEPAASVELPDPDSTSAEGLYEAAVEALRGPLAKSVGSQSLESLSLSANSERRLSSALESLGIDGQTLADLPSDADALLDVSGFGSGTLSRVADALHEVITT